MGGLLDKRLVIVSGKGGVGKSSVSAALALAAVRAGKKTLICEVNTKERVTLFLGLPPVGPEIQEIEPNLWAVDCAPAPAMREYALMVLKFKSIYAAVFENRLVRHFLRFIPSLQELVLLGKILYHLQEKNEDGSFRYDQIVMDAPATGHAISFLSVPQVLMDTIPPGPMAREAQKMRDLLVDPAVTAAVLVSLPEDMPVNETVELFEILTGRVRIQTAGVVLNCFVPERFSEAECEGLGPTEAGHWARSHRERANASLAAESRLSSGTGRPVIRLPRLYQERFGRESIEQLVPHLMSLLRGPE